MKLSDIANLIPAATVNSDNAIRNAIKAKRTLDMKIALKQKGRNNPISDAPPGSNVGDDLENDPQAKVL